MQKSKLEITPDGEVMLNGLRIPRCTGVDIRINPANPLDVTLYVLVDDVEAQYGINSTMCSD